MRSNRRRVWKVETAQMLVMWTWWIQSPTSGSVVPILIQFVCIVPVDILRTIGRCSGEQIFLDALVVRNSCFLGIGIT